MTWFDVFPQNFWWACSRLRLPTVSPSAGIRKERRLGAEIEEFGWPMLSAITHLRRDRRASIVLYVDNITQGWPGWLAKLPLVRYMPTGEVLYHEMGHHIHAAHRPVYKGKEDVAEYWRRKLWSRFMRQRYWYLVPPFYVVGKIIRTVEKLRG
jgi:hypothetical protein